jgi:tRNA threonylcarbamoyladenosine biosynthesis protein TsaE
LVAIELHTVDRHHPIVGSSAEGTVLTLLWPTEDATQAFALQWASCAAIGHAFIALHGDLGAGKTTLVRHLLKALGVQGRIKSPTYAVVEPYELPALNIWHFDFYRFADPLEWEDAGFRDLFASTGLKLAEWPEKAAAMLPVADVDLHIRTLDNATREVTLTPHTPVGLALLQAAKTVDAAESGATP